MSTENKVLANRSFGQSGIQVYPICLGGNVFGWTADEKASFEVLDAYMAAGGNFIDTANVYSSWVPGNQGGESEAILGRWMKARGNRQQVIIATKVGLPVKEGKGLGAAHISAAVEASLSRLGTDYIDLYYAHRDDQETPLEETLQAFDTLVKAGKVRVIAASNYETGRLSQALALSKRYGWARFEGLQVEYNLLDRANYESGLEGLCQADGLGVVGYYGLAAGFLTGKYREDEPLAESARSGRVKEYVNERGWKVLGVVREIATRLSATPAQVAVAWALARPGMTGPIVSGRNLQQIKEVLQAANLELSTEMISELNEVSS